jgi:hypothetical protein
MPYQRSAEMGGWTSAADALLVIGGLISSMSLKRGLAPSLEWDRRPAADNRPLSTRSGSTVYSRLVPAGRFGHLPTIGSSLLIGMF